MAMAVSACAGPPSDLASTTPETWVETTLRSQAPITTAQPVTTQPAPTDVPAQPSTTEAETSPAAPADPIAELSDHRCDGPGAAAIYIEREDIDPRSFRMYTGTDGIGPQFAIDWIVDVTAENTDGDVVFAWTLTEDGYFVDDEPKSWRTPGDRAWIQFFESRPIRYAIDDFYTLSLEDLPVWQQAIESDDTVAQIMSFASAGEIDEAAVSDSMLEWPYIYHWMHDRFVEIDQPFDFETEIDGLSGGFWPVTTTLDAEQLDGGCVKSTDVVSLIDNWSETEYAADVAGYLELIYGAEQVDDASIEITTEAIVDPNTGLVLEVLNTFTTSSGGVDFGTFVHLRFGARSV